MKHAHLVYRPPAASAGLTVVEVLVAIVILTIGVIAVVQLQAMSLRNTAQAEAINRTTRLVRDELEWQRQTALTQGEHECSFKERDGILPEGFSECLVSITPCALVFDEFGSSTLTCSAGTSPSSYRIMVSAKGPRNTELALSTLWSGVFIAGAAGTSGDTGVP